MPQGHTTFKLYQSFYFYLDDIVILSGRVGWETIFSSLFASSSIVSALENFLGQWQRAPLVQAFVEFQGWCIVIGFELFRLKES